MEAIMGKAPDPSRPPKESKEWSRFRSLLKELHEKRKRNQRKKAGKKHT
jgi:hypothetical protein